MLLYLSEDPDPVAVRLDLRLWGGERVALVEEGRAGLAPRADLFPQPPRRLDTPSRSR